MHDEFSPDRVCPKCLNTGVLSDVPFESAADLLTLAAFYAMVGDPLPRCTHIITGVKFNIYEDDEAI